MEFIRQNKKAIAITLIVVVVAILSYFLYYILINTQPLASIDSTGNVSDSNDNSNNDTMNTVKTSKGDINNPLNIRNSSIKWVGKVTAPNDIFESFDTLQNGIKAAYSNLLAYKNLHSLTTIRGIISRWAPNNENNTNGYINNVSSWTGIDPDTDLNGINDYANVISAMSKQEGNIFVSVDDVLNYIS